MRRVSQAILEISHSSYDDIKERIEKVNMGEYYLRKDTHYKEVIDLGNVVLAKEPRYNYIAILDTGGQEPEKFFGNQNYH